ncbi:MAG TPA: glycosyltransferase family 4 protein [Anaeromyxobacter sp.]|nr:glycosyltransferase family 4 protein [Anaeromyxobacter sp.]
MRRGVAILTSLFPPSVGGIQTQTLALARELAARGEEVHVVTRPSEGRPSLCEEEGVTVHRAGLARGPGPAATVAYVALAARVVSTLSTRLRVVHAHQLLSPATVALVTRAVRGVPFVVTAHASGVVGDVACLVRQRTLGTARLAALARLASAFVAVSAPIRDELLAAGIPAHRIRRIPNGVDTARFAPPDARARAAARAALGLGDGPVAVYAGRLSPEKGADVLLDAWARLPGPAGATLCVVGDGPERGALEARAARVGAGASVRFEGACGEVAPWLRAADAFVLPSRTEGLSLALLEAMASGLAIVATDVGAAREAAGPEGALLVPPERPDALAEALAAALWDRARAAALGRAARARAVARYGIAAVVERHLQLYREVASG